MRRSSLPEVLEELVSGNRLAPEDSKRILKAPRFSFDIRELLYYLAALIVTVGVVRLVVVIFSDCCTVLGGIGFCRRCVASATRARLGGASWRSHRITGSTFVFHCHWCAVERAG